MLTALCVLLNSRRKGNFFLPVRYGFMSRNFFPRSSSTTTGKDQFHAPTCLFFLFEVEICFGFFLLLVGELTFDIPTPGSV